MRYLGLGGAPLEVPHISGPKPKFEKRLDSPKYFAKMSIHAKFHQFGTTGFYVLENDKVIFQTHTPPSQIKLPVGMGSNLAWMPILAKYLGLSRRFSNFGSGPEIWGTTRGAPPRPNYLKKIFFPKFQFFGRNGSY